MPAVKAKLVSDYKKVVSTTVSFLTTSGDHLAFHQKAIVLYITQGEEFYHIPHESLMKVTTRCRAFQIDPFEEQLVATEKNMILHSVWILPTCATVEFEIASTLVGYVTLLKLQQHQEPTQGQQQSNAVQQSERNDWAIINIVATRRRDFPPTLFKSSDHDAMALGVTNHDFESLVTLCWRDYCGANRACDGNAMSFLLCSPFRLTYSASSASASKGNHDDDNDDGVVEKSKHEFCAMVTDRYKGDSCHAPYAAYWDHPTASAGDALQGISMVSPYLALVHLKVGHPPYLWSDLLVCAKIQGRWGIVAKSSSSEPHMIGPNTKGLSPPVPVPM